MKYFGPRERLLQFGPESLSDAELVAVLLRTGPQGERGTESGPRALALAGELFDRFRTLRELFGASAEELTRMRGLGDSKIAILLAVRETAHRLWSRPAEAPEAISDCESAYRFFGDLIHEGQEVLAGAFLNHRNQVITRREIFRGGLASSLASPREILRMALAANAAKIIVAHNHPSQCPEPSPEDVEFTARLEAAARVVGLSLVDHLIVCEAGQYFSFAAHRQLAKP